MALYGVDFYGASRYGPRVFLDYDASPLVASSNGFYGRLDLTWTIPVGAWSIIRLVRNAYGVPVDQDDGKVLVNSASGPGEPLGTRAAPIRRFTDDSLEQGRFQYYSIWVYVPSVGEWTRAALTTGLPLKNFGYSNRLWELLPSIYRTKSGSLLDPADNSELKTFLRVFGAGLDGVRAEYETLLHVNDPDRVSGNLLPLMAQQYGQFFEPELGMKQMRTLLRNTMQLYRSKGTVPGVTGFVSSVTGYGCSVRPLKNLMLDYNDSSAEESVGRWFARTNSTLTRYVSDEIVDAPSPLNNMRRVGIFRLTSNAAGNMDMIFGDTGGSTARLLGVPVVGGVSYTASAYVRAGSVARTVSMYINWYDKAGVYLSTSLGSDTANALGAWTARAATTAAAPAAAVYATLSVFVLATAAAGEVHYFDAFQLEASGAATDFEDARLIDVVAVAPRVNRVVNSSFEVDVAGWTGLTRSTTQSYSGSSSGTMSPAAANVAATTTISTAVGSTYIYSVWARGTGGVSLTALGTSTAVTLTSAWVRLSRTFTATASTTTVGVLSSTAGEMFFDSVLVELGVNLLPYFDGSTYQSTGDSIWEGTAYASRSHFYPQRRTKNARVNSLLPQYTPMGSSFRVRYAQP